SALLRSPPSLFPGSFVPLIKRLIMKPTAEKLSPPVSQTVYSSLSRTHKHSHSHTHTHTHTLTHTHTHTHTHSSSRSMWILNPPRHVSLWRSNPVRSHV